jgi:hypothetical protein
MARPVSEEVHPDAIKRIERRLHEIPDDITTPRRYAGPAYNAIEVHGFNVDPRDPTRAKVPSVKFPGTDAQYQELLDKSNEATLRKSYQKRDKLEVKLHRLQVNIRKLETLQMRAFKTRILNLETIAMFSGTEEAK